MDVEKPEVTITTMDFAQTPLAGPYSAFYDCLTFKRIHLYLNDCALAFAPLVSNLPTLPHPPQSSSTSGVHCASFTPFPAAAALAPSEPLHAQPSGNAEAIRRVEPQPEAPAAGDDVPLHGGVTRFWTPDKRAHLDVHPKLGRVLISQQRMLVHSGEEVTQRVKYTMRSDFLFTQIVENAVQHT